VIVGVAMIALLGMAGLVTDGGLAWANRRAAQNVADTAALAGTRIISVDRFEKVFDPSAPPTFADPGSAIQQAIQNAFTINANSGQTFDALTWGVPGAPEYTDFKGRRFPNADFATGGPLYVSPGPIPGEAQGVYVPANTQSGTIVIQVVGIDSIQIGVDATAVTGPSFPVGKLLPLVVRDRWTECLNEACTHTRDPIDGIAGNYQRPYQEGCLYRFRDTNPPEIECNGITDPDFPDLSPPDFSGSFGWIDWNGGNSPTSDLNPWIRDPALAPTDWFAAVCSPADTDVTCRVNAGSLPAPSDDQFWRLEGTTGNRNVSISLTETLYDGKEVYVPIWREAETGTGTNATFEIRGFGVFRIEDVVTTGSHQGFDGRYLGSWRGGNVEQCTIVPSTCTGGGTSPVPFAINLAR
jgi:hypothetical protein